MIDKKGFTLAELLVVVGVVAIMGLVITEVFSRSLRGGNKSQIIAAIKQNGQATLELMDKTIRPADQVVCPKMISDGVLNYDVIAVVKEGSYTRFRYKSPVAGSSNGQILKDNPVWQPAVQSQDQFELDTCTNTPISVNDTSITDTNTKSGVSVSAVLPGGATIFTRNKKSGYKDSVVINFNLSPAALAPSAIAGQIDPVTFTTTIELR